MRREVRAGRDKELELVDGYEELPLTGGALALVPVADGGPVRDHCCRVPDGRSLGSDGALDGFVGGA